MKRYADKYSIDLNGKAKFAFPDLPKYCISENPQYFQKKI